MSRIITRFKRKKALVASFPRSGTHFLMNTLGKNFWHQAVPYVDLTGVEEQYYGTNLAHFFEVLNINCQDPVIVKTHFEVDFFAQLATRQDNNKASTVLNIILEWFDVFYIWREVGPVMDSYAKHLTATAMVKNPRANPVAETGKELMEMEPWGSPLQHQMFQYPTFYEKWASHGKRRPIICRFTLLNTRILIGTLTTKYTDYQRSWTIECYNRNGRQSMKT